jgi:hypothetical protein
MLRRPKVAETSERVVHEQPLTPRVEARVRGGTIPLSVNELVKCVGFPSSWTYGTLETRIRIRKRHALLVCFSSAGDCQNRRVFPLHHSC